MPAETIKKIGIILMLGLLTASAFFIRLENFKNSKTQSIDEVVYYRMAKQILNEGLSGYNTIPYGRELAATGRPLPDYFFQPLFKHPPLFTFLIALSMKIFGVNGTSAGYVSLLFGVLLIPLTYLLGCLVSNSKVGLISAILMWLDPINTITSQKVWLETTLSFFTVLSVYFFLYALLRKKNTFYILSGITCGLAALTKYPGILALFIVLIYSVLWHRNVFRNRVFVTSILIPTLLLLPWAIWNFTIYGAGFLKKQAGVHNILLALPRTATLGVIIVLFLFWFFARFKKSYPQSRSPTVTSDSAAGLRHMIFTLWGVAIAWMIRREIIHGLNFFYLPRTGWQQGLFWGEPPTFYFGKLIEFSPLFIFSFAAFFFNTRKNTDKKAILFLGSGTLFLFYTIWGSYQSRYILAAIPFLIILGVQLGREFFERCSNYQNMGFRLMGRGLLLLFLFYVIARTIFLNLVLSFPNDMCYF